MSLQRRALRVVDANLNRACEGLRVLEDVARFALEDGGIASTLRELRHRLRGQAPAQSLVAARDSENDPGRERTEQGPPRRDLEEAVLANARRCQEALRVLEEFLGRGMGRLELYALEKSLLAGLRRQSLRARVRGVYGILDPELCGGEPGRVLLGWLKAGLRLVQLRDKRAAAPERLSLARDAARLCREFGALFLINDRPELAAACGADGAHLGAEDMTVPEARRILGEFKLIGSTVRLPEEARAAEARGADYVALGRIFPSPSKPGAPQAALQALAAVKAAVRVPVVAVGGISADNQDQAWAAGADAVASISSVADLLKRPGEKAANPAASLPS